MALKRLTNIADIQVGYQTRGRIQEQAEGTHCLIQGSDFDEQHNMQLSKLASFSPKRNPEPYTVHRGDILFQARGIDIFAYYLDDEISNTLAASSFYILRPYHQGVLAEYLEWWLNQDPVQYYFKTQASGTWMSFISKKTLAQLSVPVPSIEIQEEIVAVNALWDTERALCAELSDLRGKLVASVCKKTAQD